MRTNLAAQLVGADHASDSRLSSSGSLMTVMPVRLGLWNLFNSSRMACTIGAVGSAALEASVGGSRIRTCFTLLGDETSDQQVLGCCFRSCSFSSSSEVDPARFEIAEVKGQFVSVSTGASQAEPGSSCPRWSRFLPAMSPSQCRCLMAKTGSA